MPKAELVYDVTAIKVGSILRHKLMNVPTIPLHGLAHGHVEVSRYLVDLHVPRQVAARTRIDFLKRSLLPSALLRTMENVPG